MFKADYTYISIIVIKLLMEGFSIFIWKVFKKILFIESLVFWKKNEKQNDIKVWTFI